MGNPKSSPTYSNVGLTWIEPIHTGDFPALNGDVNSGGYPLPDVGGIEKNSRASWSRIYWDLPTKLIPSPW